MQYLETMIEKLDLKSYNNQPQIKKISEKLKTRPEYITLVFLSLVLVFLVFTPFGHTILKAFFTFFYPAYRSFRAKISECKEDDKKWLIYWVVYGMVYSFEVLFGEIIGVSFQRFFWCYKAIYLEEAKF